jgi:hypothetical protein
MYLTRCHRKIVRKGGHHRLSHFILLSHQPSRRTRPAVPCAVSQQRRPSRDHQARTSSRRPQARQVVQRSGLAATADERTQAAPSAHPTRLAERAGRQVVDGEHRRVSGLHRLALRGDRQERTGFVAEAHGVGLIRGVQQVIGAEDGGQARGSRNSSARSGRARVAPAGGLEGANTAGPVSSLPRHRLLRLAIHRAPRTVCTSSANPLGLEMVATTPSV